MPQSAVLGRPGGGDETIDIDFTDEALQRSFPYVLENQIIGKQISVGGANWTTFGVSERGFCNSPQL